MPTIPYQVAVAPDEIIVRLDRTLFQPADLTELLDYLQLKALRRQSQLTDAEIEQLAEEINQSGWKRIKQNFLAGLA